MGQTILKRNKTFPKKNSITQSQWDAAWIYFEHEFVPLILNNNENSSLYCKQSQQHFHKNQKIVFSVGKQGEEYGTDFFRRSSQ